MSRDETARLTNYLDHMLEAISRIQEYIHGFDEGAFRQDRRTQDAVIRNLEIVGEAARNVEKRYPEFAAQHSEVPWTIAYEMRNVLAHGYFKVDLAIVWRTIESDLPALATQIERAAASLGDAHTPSN